MRAIIPESEDHWGPSWKLPTKVILVTLQCNRKRMFCLKVVLGKFDILKKRNKCWLCIITIHQKMNVGDLHAKGKLVKL